MKGKQLIQMGCIFPFEACTVVGTAIIDDWDDIVEAKQQLIKKLYQDHKNGHPNLIKSKPTNKQNSR